MFTARDISAKGGRGLQAFTLLEVTLALAILMLLVGALYAIVDGTVRGASELEAKQDRNRELSAFLSLCRKTFRDMPASVQFQARAVPDGQRYDSELIFRNAPGLWWWGDAKNASHSTILGVRGQVGGMVGLGILQGEENIDSYLLDSNLSGGDGGASRPYSWLMLLPNLRDAEWQFFDPGSATWLKAWNNPTGRPTYAQLTLTTAEGTSTYTFRVTPVVQLSVVNPLNPL